MSFLITGFCVIFVLGSVENRLVSLSNGWSIAYPCSDNNKVTMVVDNNEMSKEEFVCLLTIQGINKDSHKLLITIDDPDKTNGGYIRKNLDYDLRPGRKAFSVELKGNNGKLPKVLSINANGVNYCKNPNPQLPAPYENTNQNLHSGQSQSTVEKPTDALHVSGNNFDNQEDECGVRQIPFTPLIISGSESKPGNWPWHVALYKFERTKVNYICGGTLISKYTVLTAAHCVTERGVPVTPEIINVIAGRYNLNGGDETPQDKQAFKILVNELYNHGTLVGDIALIKLKTQVFFNKYVQPACVWNNQLYQKTPPNIYGMVAGWGFDNKYILSSTLKEATLPKVAVDACYNSNPDFYSKTLNKYNFCAGYRNGTTACNGDSGGGFHVFVQDNPNDPNSRKGKWFVHGIVSLAASLDNTNLCDPNQYVIFTAVGEFTEWININM